MIVWLWDACGPGRGALGVTSDRARALRIAEAHLRSEQASVVKVEAALLMSGICVLTPGYQRTGHGWTARRRASRVTWTPFGAPELAAS